MEKTKHMGSTKQWTIIQEYCRLCKDYHTKKIRIKVWCDKCEAEHAILTTKCIGRLSKLEEQEEMIKNAIKAWCNK